MNDERIRRRLWIVLLVYETLVIGIVAGAGLNIALAGGGSLPMAAPLAPDLCAEALRIPLSAMATRLRWPGRLLAAIALLAIAVGSAEGLAVAFEAFLQNRVVEIMRAAPRSNGRSGPSIRRPTNGCCRTRASPASQAK